jgi:hypothetical protein
MSNAIEPKDGIEQVREILVGAIQRELERKVVRVESHLAARLAELQQETRRRTEVIESHLKKETEMLAARLDAEVVEIKETLRGLARDHRESVTAVEQRAAKLEEATSRAQHELRGQILDQAKSFLDELTRAREEFAEALDRELAAFEAEPAEESSHRESRQSENRVPT